jgi:hypothetical protein
MYTIQNKGLIYGIHDTLHESTHHKKYTNIYAKCCVFVVMLRIIMVNVVMPSVINDEYCCAIDWVINSL